MAQSRRLSLIEAVTSSVIAFFLSVTINQYLLPLFGFNVSLDQSIVIVGIYTLCSIVRSYILRRAFNHLASRSEP